jgi:hypothetical protein
MKILKVPKYFLLKDNHINRTISFLRKLITSYDKAIGIDFSNLKETRKGDLMVFMAQIEKSVIAHNKQFYRAGKLPTSRQAKKLLLFSGKMVHDYKPLPSSVLSDEKKATLVNPRLIDGIVKELRKVGINEYYIPFNTFLTEIIGNAVEHGIENKKINWWLIQDIDRVKKTIIYTFVDMGNGIIDTHKKAGLPIIYWIKRDSSIVLDALYGKLGSSTKKTYRGRGLPQLRRMIEAEIVSDVVIITNKVSLSFKNNCFSSMKNPNFVGTYYSWTINQNNITKWKSLRST